MFSVVFDELLLFRINVLDRSLIPATSSMMSLDMLRVSLRAWSSSLWRCLISSSWLSYGYAWCTGPVGRQVLPDVRAGPCCRSLVLYGVAHGCLESSCGRCPTLCSPCLDLLLSHQNCGRCPTGSLANIVLVGFG